MCNLARSGKLSAASFRILTRNPIIYLQAIFLSLATFLAALFALACPCIPTTTATSTDRIPSLDFVSAESQLSTSYTSNCSSEPSHPLGLPSPVAFPFAFPFSRRFSAKSKASTASYVRSNGTCSSTRSQTNRCITFARSGQVGSGLARSKCSRCVTRQGSVALEWLSRSTLQCV